MFKVFPACVDLSNGQCPIHYLKNVGIPLLQKWCASYRYVLLKCLSACMWVRVRFNCVLVYSACWPAVVVYSLACSTLPKS